MKPLVQFLLLLLMLPMELSGQAIDNAASYKNLPSDRYIHGNYENDFFAGPDMYYTQGLHFELVAPWARMNPLTKLLIHPKSTCNRFGIAVEHDIYTPSDIDSPEVLRGDRPYTACLFIKSFVHCIDTVKKQRFSVALSTGIMGPLALGDQTQTTVHFLFNNVTPYGWQNQLHNEPIINYQADWEKEFSSYLHSFSFSANAIARAGTLSDKFSGGFSIMVGKFLSPYAHHNSAGNSWVIYGYEHPSVNFIAYDATLEGGMINRTSPYKLMASDITPMTLENRFGLVVMRNHFAIELFQSYLSREFYTGLYHVWGGIDLTLLL